jgi:hypothetical protein
LDDKNIALLMGQELGQFKGMPSGLHNAAAMYKWLMETVSRGLTYEPYPVSLEMIANWLHISRASVQLAKNVPAVP